MREWRNILKEKLVDANIFEEGQNNLLKRLRKRKMNMIRVFVGKVGWVKEDGMSHAHTSELMLYAYNERASWSY